MNQPYQPSYVGVGGIFIDDIVFPDGRTQMAVLGGGVVHAAMGMKIWGQRAGILACAGRDLPEAAHLRLAHSFDLQGIEWLEIPQARAWQVFEWDGRRRELPRVEELAPFVERPAPASTPAACRGARGVYLLRDAQLAGWRACFPDAVLLWEPLQQYMLPQNAQEFRDTLPLVDIVSPNWLEAEAIYGMRDPDALVQSMLDDGVPVVALRMGADGSLVGRQGESDLLAVPAVRVPDIADQTGAGNTYCGGFLVGWCETGRLYEAACWGAVAASFALEVTGVADPPADLDGERERRLAELRDGVVATRR